MKTCSKCNEAKELADFQPHRAYKDGHKSSCRACDATYLREWKSRNKDKVSKSNAAHYLSHRGTLLPRAKERHKANYERDPQPSLDRSSQYYWEHRDNRKEYQRGYYARTKTRDREKLSERARQREARKNNQMGVVRSDYRYVLYEVQKGRCFYCNCVLLDAHAGHMEHRIPLSRGGIHDEDNLCLSCPPCNQEKAAMTAEEYFRYLENKKKGLPPVEARRRP